MIVGNRRKEEPVDSKNFLELLELVSDDTKYKDKLQQLLEQEKTIETKIAFDSEIKADSTRMLSEANGMFREAEEVRTNIKDRERLVKTKEEELKSLEKDISDRDFSSKQRH